MKLNTDIVASKFAQLKKVTKIIVDFCSFQFLPCRVCFSYYSLVDLVLVVDDVALVLVVDDVAGTPRVVGRGSRVSFSTQKGEFFSVLHSEDCFAPVTNLYLYF